MKTFIYKRLALMMCCVLISILFIGCKQKTEEIKKIKDLEFTVVEEADIPEELLTSINEKKNSPFKMSYTNDNYLYIVRGYGEQKSGGYSITVDELFEAENSIYFKTTLQGPGPKDLVTQVVTYPYIVVKTELIDKKVVFE